MAFMVNLLLLSRKLFFDIIEANIHKFDKATCIVESVDNMWQVVNDNQNNFGTDNDIHSDNNKIETDFDEDYKMKTKTLNEEDNRNKPAALHHLLLCELHKNDNCSFCEKTDYKPETKSENSGEITSHNTKSDDNPQNKSDNSDTSISDSQKTDDKPTKFEESNIENEDISKANDELVDNIYNMLQSQQTLLTNIKKLLSYLEGNKLLSPSKKLDQIINKRNLNAKTSLSEPAIKINNCLNLNKLSSANQPSNRPQSKSDKKITPVDNNLKLSLQTLNMPKVVQLSSTMITPLYPTLSTMSDLIMRKGEAQLIHVNQKHFEIFENKLRQFLINQKLSSLDDNCRNECRVMFYNKRQFIRLETKLNKQKLNLQNSIKNYSKLIDKNEDNLNNFENKLNQTISKLGNANENREMVQVMQLNQKVFNDFEKMLKTVKLIDNNNVLELTTRVVDDNSVEKQSVKTQQHINNVNKNNSNKLFSNLKKSDGKNWENLSSESPSTIDDSHLKIKETKRKLKMEINSDHGIKIWNEFPEKIINQPNEKILKDKNEIEEKFDQKIEFQNEPKTIKKEDTSKIEDTINSKLIEKSNEELDIEFQEKQNIEKGISKDNKDKLTLKTKIKAELKENEIKKTEEEIDIKTEQKLKLKPVVIKNVEIFRNDVERESEMMENSKTENDAKIKEVKKKLTLTINSDDEIKNGYQFSDRIKNKPIEKIINAEEECGEQFDKKMKCQNKLKIIKTEDINKNEGKIDSKIVKNLNEELDIKFNEKINIKKETQIDNKDELNLKTKNTDELKENEIIKSDKKVDLKKHKEIIQNENEREFKIIKNSKKEFDIKIKQKPNVRKETRNENNEFDHKLKIKTKCNSQNENVIEQNLKTNELMINKKMDNKHHEPEINEHQIKPFNSSNQKKNIKYSKLKLKSIRFKTKTSNNLIKTKSTILIQNKNKLFTKCRIKNLPTTINNNKEEKLITKKIIRNLENTSKDTKFLQTNINNKLETEDKRINDHVTVTKEVIKAKTTPKQDIKENQENLLARTTKEIKQQKCAPLNNTTKATVLEILPTSNSSKETEEISDSEKETTLKKWQSNQNDRKIELNNTSLEMVKEKLENPKELLSSELDKNLMEAKKILQTLNDKETSKNNIKSIGEGNLITVDKIDNLSKVLTSPRKKDKNLDDLELSKEMVKKLKDKENTELENKEKNKRSLKTLKINSPKDLMLSTPERANETKIVDANIKQKKIKLLPNHKKMFLPKTDKEFDDNIVNISSNALEQKNKLTNLKNKPLKREHKSPNNSPKRDMTVEEKKLSPQQEEKRLSLATNEEKLLQKFAKESEEKSEYKTPTTKKEPENVLPKDNQLSKSKENQSKLVKEEKRNVVTKIQAPSIVTDTRKTQKINSKNFPTLIPSEKVVNKSIKSNSIKKLGVENSKEKSSLTLKIFSSKTAILRKNWNQIKSKQVKENKTKQNESVPKEIHLPKYLFNNKSNINFQQQQSKQKPNSYLGKYIQETNSKINIVQWHEDDLNNDKTQKN